MKAQAEEINIKSLEIDRLHKMIDKLNNDDHNIGLTVNEKNNHLDEFKILLDKCSIDDMNSISDMITQKISMHKENQEKYRWRLDPKNLS